MEITDADSTSMLSNSSKFQEKWESHSPEEHQLAEEDTFHLSSLPSARPNFAATN